MRKTSAPATSRSSSARPSGVPEIDADAALVAAEMLDEEVAARRAGDQARGDEAADRVAEARVLDLDDLGAPVAQHGGRRGHEAPVGDLDHPHAGEHVGHRRALS